MKLFATPTSPYARKVRVVLAEKRIECEVEMVPLLASPESPVPHHNPLGKVPTLVLDDGESIYDSSVIVGYLDHRTPVAHLIPQDNYDCALVRRWEALADGMCDAAVAVVMERRRPVEMQDVSVIDKQMLKIERGLLSMSQDLADGKWCMGEAFTLADIAVGCVLGYIDLRLSDIFWRDQYPNLERLYQQLLKRPSFRDTMPPVA